MADTSSPDLFTPVELSSNGETIFSIQVEPAGDLREELERYAAEDRIPIETQVRNALTFYRESFMTREDHARETLAFAVREFCRPRHGKLSRKMRNALASQLDEELRNLRAAGSLGNVLLPQELYEFVRSKIASGEFSSPTDLLTAAMPSLRAERGKSPRAEIWNPDRCLVFG
jgi:hypothetical protein